MTDNKFIDAFKRMLTMTLALIMVLGSVVPIATQEASAFDGKKGSKYTVYDGGQIVYGSGSGGGLWEWWHDPGVPLAFPVESASS